MLNFTLVRRLFFSLLSAALCGRTAMAVVLEAVRQIITDLASEHKVEQRRIPVFLFLDLFSLLFTRYTPITRVQHSLLTVPMNSSRARGQRHDDGGEEKTLQERLPILLTSHLSLLRPHLSLSLSPLFPSPLSPSQARRMAIWSGVILILAVFETVCARLYNSLGLYAQALRLALNAAKYARGLCLCSTLYPPPQCFCCRVLLISTHCLWFLYSALN